MLAADFEEGATGAMPGLNHPIIGATPIVRPWYHAAVTYDGTTLQLYLNGVPDGLPRLRRAAAARRQHPARGARHGADLHGRGRRLLRRLAGRSAHLELRAQRRADRRGRQSRDRHRARAPGALELQRLLRPRRRLDRAYCPIRHAASGTRAGAGCRAVTTRCAPRRQPGARGVVPVPISR